MHAGMQWSERHGGVCQGRCRKVTCSSSSSSSGLSSTLQQADSLGGEVPACEGSKSEPAGHLKAVLGLLAGSTSPQLMRCHGRQSRRQAQRSVSTKCVRTLQLKDGLRAVSPCSTARRWAATRTPCPG